MLLESVHTTNIVAVLLIGLVAGWLASLIVGGGGIVRDLVTGLVGAVVGGYLFTFFGADPVTGLNIYSMIVAVIGAVVVLFLYHAIVGRGRAIR